MEWRETATGAYCRRWEPWDVTVGVIIGSAGVLLIDTRANVEEGEHPEVVAGLSVDLQGPADGVVNEDTRHLLGFEEPPSRLPVAAGTVIP